MLRGMECSVAEDLIQPEKAVIIQMQSHQEWSAEKILWIIWTSDTNPDYSQSKLTWFLRMKNEHRTHLASSGLP